MDELPQAWHEQFKRLGAHGATLLMMGSFLLYALGYLALRFHLTALGIGTDLALLDERYLFAGAKFLVYLGAMTPGLILLVLSAGGVSYGVYRMLPASGRSALARGFGGVAERMTRPAPLLLGGIAFSVFVIQFFMRDCFEFNNLLLLPAFPAAGYLSDWLLRENEGRISLFFLGLIAGCAISGSLLLRVRRQSLGSPFLVFAYYLLCFLALLQVLLLPINYGYLVQDKSLAKVASLDGLTPLEPGTEAWLVWESKESMTYLLRNTRHQPTVKSLVTLPRNQIKRIEIVAYNRIFPTLFAASPGIAP